MCVHVIIFFRFLFQKKKISLTKSDNLTIFVSEGLSISQIIFSLSHYIYTMVFLFSQEVFPALSTSSYVVTLLAKIGFAFGAGKVYQQKRTRA